MNLNLIRSGKDTFYFALRDESAASDALHVIKFSIGRTDDDADYHEEN